MLLNLDIITKIREGEKLPVRREMRKVASCNKEQNV